MSKPNTKSNEFKLEDVSIIAWLLENKIKQEKGELIEFRNHPFLYDIYRDFSPKIVGLKAAQVGMSVLQVLKFVWAIKHYNIDGIYTMPTDSDMNVFVGGKVNRIIKHNPILQEYTHDKDSVEQKKIGDGMAYFRGSFSKRAAISVTSDLNVHDEEDFSDQIVIGDYESRLQHSKFKWEWRFGHPTTIGVGVTRHWENSDQKHWFVKCKCGKEQFMKWPESICFERKVYQCKYCGLEITDKQRIQGRWVSKYKEREYSGYWIPLLIAPWIDAKEIIKKSQEKTEEYFYNRVLGLPYVGAGNKVTQEDILGNLTKDNNTQEGTIVIGCDTGLKLRYVVGNQEGIFHYGESKEISWYANNNQSPYSEIEKFLKIYPKSVAIFDQGGDIIGVRELSEKYLGRVFLAHYRSDRKTMQLVRWGEGDEEGNVLIDRNRTMQLVIDEFKARRIPIYGTEGEWWNYWLHWSHIYRVAEEDNLGVLQYKWMRADRDDWVHATIYWRVGISRFSSGEGIVFGANEFDKINVSPMIDPITRTAQHSPHGLKRNWNID